MTDQAVNFLLANITVVLRVLEENDNSPTRAYQQLVKDLPGIKAVMSDRAFRSYWKFLPVISHLQDNLDKTEAELSNIRQSQKQRESQPQQASLFKTEIRQEKLDKAVNIAGWTVRQRPNGFYYLYKTINKQTHCIYLGKTLDRKKALNKIKMYKT